jgi:hypothetical protein
MGARDSGIKAGPQPKGSAVLTDPARGAGSRASLRVAGIGALLGLIVGGGAAYAAASWYFNEQAALIAQAADMRVNAANQRTQEVEGQYREFVQQADAQQREIVAQAQEQELAFLQRANERERKLAQPDLPLRVWMRPPALGPRMVARMHNFGSKELNLAVTARRASTQQQSEWQVVIPPNGTQDVGVDASWSFAPGDDIELSQNGFRPMSFHVRPRASQQADTTARR